MHVDIRYVNISSNLIRRFDTQWILLVKSSHSNYLDTVSSSVPVVVVVCFYFKPYQWYMRLKTKKYIQINKSKSMYRSHPNNLQSTTKQKLIKPLGIIENYKKS